MECYVIICSCKLPLELKRSSEKEHIIEGSTIQDVLVEKVRKKL